MSDIERRLKALEKRARADTEHWHALDGEILAISSAIMAMGAPVCAGKPARVRAIIANLKIYEEVGRTQNEHGQMMRRLRYIRKFFEDRLKKSEGRAGVDGKPQRGK